MRAEYDSEADALSIDLVDVPCWEGADHVDGNYCTVALAGGRPVNIELLTPTDHLELLALAAARHGLDAQAIEAAAHSALAAPDRVVVVDAEAPA